ncbi:unnamed protein product [Bursaphelenchus okinawaensis]|uniref:CWH43-like N-terminal domain-containing protein n=1 Tax=Bursaphelenchus okinawaensis TaxID=465554 RepID=A0A811L458_9BILA|nr:unnamed protein product [Bursaphelenchus okinawaensis]CAG9116958.1 unnamed protein product [Bursaphelenchus okinawaensis]
MAGIKSATDQTNSGCVRDSDCGEFDDNCGYMDTSRPSTPSTRPISSNSSKIEHVYEEIEEDKPTSSCCLVTESDRNGTYKSSGSINSKSRTDEGTPTTSRLENAEASYLGTSPKLLSSSDSDLPSQSNDRSISPASTRSSALLLSSTKPIELFKVTYKKLVLLSLGPVLLSLFLVFAIGFGYDYKKLLNYKWTCGNVLLPSLSRIINLPIERVLWHFGVVLHAGLRPVYLIQAYLVNRRVHSAFSYKGIIRFLALAGLVTGFLELLFTVALTIIGERENGNVHLILFVGFIINCLINFITSAFCFRCSKEFYENKTYHSHFKTRIVLILLMLLFVPMILVFFVLYWQYCVTIAYEFFAIFEYMTVLIVYSNHIMILRGLRNYEFKIVKP